MCKRIYKLGMLAAVSGFALSTQVEAASLASDFSVDADGWTAVTLGNGAGDAPLFGTAPNSSFAVDYHASGGLPGGYVSATDPNGDWTYFLAPSKFLGNQSAFVGGSLSYDSQQVANGGTFINAPNVALKSGSTVLVYGSNNPPADAPAWKHFVIPFAADGAGWFVGSLNGAAATGAALANVLANLDAVFISAEFITPITETTALDNVRYAPVPLPPAIAGFAAALGLLGARRRA